MTSKEIMSAAEKNQEILFRLLKEHEGDKQTTARLLALYEESKRGISQQRGRSETWKCPFKWTNEEVHELVMREVGSDIAFATGFRVLLKLWVPSEMDGDIFIPETMRSNDISVMGMIIGMGEDAFRDSFRFPSGPTHTYGEWAIFRPYEDQKIKVCNKQLLTFVSDERLIGLGTEAHNIQSALKLEEEHKFAGG